MLHNIIDNASVSVSGKAVRLGSVKRSASWIVGLIIRTIHEADK